MGAGVEGSSGSRLRLWCALDGLGLAAPGRQAMRHAACKPPQRLLSGTLQCHLRCHLQYHLRYHRTL